jgi:hypothetical protein|tara:strand:- start:395 stop:640 length:246 start_codon:yes stop_codon:yes gene_type:complete
MKDGYITRTSSTIPFGYEMEEEASSFLKPIEEELRILKEVSEAVFHKEISLGIGVDWLEAETGRKMSRPGLKKHVDKVYGR